MPDTQQRTASLAGSWTRTSRDACADVFPDRLVLHANGLYQGMKEPAGSYTLWDAGTFRTNDAGEAEISTANDAIVRYRYTLEGDTLTFRTDDGCAIGYRRER